MEHSKLRVEEIEHIAKMKQQQQQQQQSTKSPETAEEESKSRDPPTPYGQNFFSYDKADSEAMDEAMASQQSLPHQSSSSPPRNYPPQQSHHNQQPDPPIEAMQRLEELRHSARQVEIEATSAEDHLQALTIRYEDLRMQAERAEILKNEMKPKKKGFFGCC